MCEGSHPSPPAPAGPEPTSRAPRGKEETLACPPSAAVEGAGEEPGASVSPHRGVCVAWSRPSWRTGVWAPQRVCGKMLGWCGARALGARGWQDGLLSPSASLGRAYATPSTHCPVLPGRCLGLSQLFLLTMTPLCVCSHGVLWLRFKGVEQCCFWVFVNSRVPLLRGKGAPNANSPGHALGG